MNFSEEQSGISFSKTAETSERQVAVKVRLFHQVIERAQREKLLYLQMEEGLKSKTLAYTRIRRILVRAQGEKKKRKRIYEFKRLTIVRAVIPLFVIERQGPLCFSSFVS